MSNQTPKMVLDYEKTVQQAEKATDEMLSDVDVAVAAFRARKKALEAPAAEGGLPQPAPVNVLTPADIPAEVLDSGVTVRLLLRVLRSSHPLAELLSALDSKEAKYRRLQEALKTMTAEELDLVERTIAARRQGV